MTIQKNISIKKYNTFGIDVKAEKFVKINSLEELLDFLNQRSKQDKQLFLLGGGSNMLLTKDIKSTVLHLNIKGIKILKENKYTIYIEVNAGENWHDFVQWSLKNDFGGIENLSLIPGNVGTCPIQNIGAYGVEVKDTIYQVKAIEISTGKTTIFKNSECEFGYRNSIFKNKVKGEYIITSVVFKLTKTKHQLKYNYGAIQAELAKKNIKKPTIQNISESIIFIRNAKLPNPKELGNSGSFFKNPVVDSLVFFKVQKSYPEMPFYLVENKYKIPAGWLIEKAGFKGKRFGDAGVHKNQALVLVNYGNASGKDILKLAKKIQKTIKKQFDINLEMEVNIF
jgi:UDP-N-acetylmuramate dehydrogenase